MCPIKKSFWNDSEIKKLSLPDVVNVTVVIDEPVFFSEVAGEKNSTGFREVIRIRSKVGDRLTRELH
jgi:hypothetical protein